MYFKYCFYPSWATARTMLVPLLYGFSMSLPKVERWTKCSKTDVEYLWPTFMPNLKWNVNEINWTNSDDRSGSVFDGTLYFVVSSWLFENGNWNIIAHHHQCQHANTKHAHTHTQSGQSDMLNWNACSSPPPPCMHSQIYSQRWPISSPDTSFPRAYSLSKWEFSHCNSG